MDKSMDVLDERGRLIDMVKTFIYGINGTISTGIQFKDHYW